MAWATEQEALEEWRSRTMSPADLEAYYEDLRGQQEAEIWAENAWLRAAEYDPRMEDPREW